jgi:hypothetical protein
MPSEQVWAIEELVRLICYRTLKYKALSIWDDGQGHDGLVHDYGSRQTLGRCVLFLNRFISRIAVEVLWEDLDGLEALWALFPPDYWRTDEDGIHVSRPYRSAH